ncbi:MAG TPA: hypothetical protein VK119_04410 [Bacillota bacterium]|nr:hypothetical protein [Bacillota bacterium]
MKETLKLTKFFISSFYTKPKQQILKVVLLIALFYLFFQLAIVSIAVYFIADTYLFMFYNLAISSILIFALTCYLSTIQFFSFKEFTILASHPISYKKISTAKLVSSILVPLILSLIIQVPALILLIIDFKMIEFAKLIILMPIINGFIVLLLLFVLSFVNKFYYKYKNKTSYLMTNFIMMSLFPLASIALYITFSKNKNIVELFEKVDLESMTGWIHLINSILHHLFENIMEIPLLREVIERFVSNDISIPFILISIFLTLISALFYFVIVHNTSTNYYKNGTHDNAVQTSLKGSSVHITENQWSNYLQREVWVLKSEAYFKMQVILGILLPPVTSLIFLILIQNDVFPTILNITEEGVLDTYFSYTVLFLSCINNISGTPYSREGRYHDLLKCNPFNPTYVYLSKVVIASTMSLIAVLLSFIIFAIFGYWRLETVIMLMIVAGLVICYNLLTPLFDSKKPLTEWVNPSEAVKSNPNVLISLLYGLPLLIIIAVLHVGFIWLNIHSFLVSFIILLVVLVTIYILIKKLRVTL